MQEKKNNHQNDRMTGSGEGPQGVDKAPGEETSQHRTEVVKETQKNKKVDADPRQENNGREKRLP